MNELFIKIGGKWFKLPAPVRFVLIGTVNAAISYVIFAITLFLLGKNYYQLCVILQWTLSSVPSYLNQKFFVFNTRGNYLPEYLKCCSTWAVSYLLNALILGVLVGLSVMKNVYIAQFLAITIVSAVTYVLFKFFAFKQK